MSCRSLRHTCVCFASTPGLSQVIHYQASTTTTAIFSPTVGILPFVCLNHGNFNDVPPDESRLARLITTVDDAQNGFRNELLPMALSHQTKASQGLMESILVLCAFHVGGPSQALQHKARALRLLHQALQTDHPDDLSAKLATCMLLCVYGVFDTTDGNWKIHLKGAKTLVQSPSEAGHDIDSRQGVSSFLRSWMLYHDVWPNSRRRCQALEVAHRSRFRHLRRRRQPYAVQIFRTSLVDTDGTCRL
jgi:hypothetical protein